jgi:hypothetical protein
MSVTFYPNVPDAFVRDEEVPEMNVSNANARMLFVNLGLEFDYCGRISPTDLLVAIACSDPIDTGVPSHVDSSGPGATMIEGGIRPGYFADRYKALQEIACYAHKHGADIVWA